MTGFQIQCQNWAWIKLVTCFSRKTVEIDQARDFNDFFSAKIGVKCSPSSILKLYLEFSHQGTPFRPRTWKNWKFIFLTSHSRHFQNLISCTRTKKADFVGENGIVLLFTSHGTGVAPKTWKKLSSVKNETPYCTRVKQFWRYGDLVKVGLQTRRRSFEHGDIRNRAKLCPCRKTKRTKSPYAVTTTMNNLYFVEESFRKVTSTSNVFVRLIRGHVGNVVVTRIVHSLNYNEQSSYKPTRKHS